MLHKVELHKRKAMSLVEVLVAMAITCLVVFGMTGLLMSSSESSDRTQTKANFDNTMALASDEVSKDLREARAVILAPNGLSVIYSCPQQVNAADPNSAYLNDPKALGPSHTLALSNGSLVLDGNSAQPILTGIPLVDPATGLNIIIFSYGINNKEIVTHLVSQQTTTGGKLLIGTVDSRVQLRNM